MPSLDELLAQLEEDEEEGTEAHPIDIDFDSDSESVIAIQTSARLNEKKDGCTQADIPSPASITAQPASGGKATDQDQARSAVEEKKSFARDVVSESTTVVTSLPGATEKTGKKRPRSRK